MKRIIFITLGVIAFAIVAILIYLNVAFPKVSKAPDLKIEATPERLERGKYLANHVTVCIDCHSQRDFSYFSGPIVSGTEGRGGDRFGEEMGFPGTFYPPNLTPHHLGSWTDGEIYRAITSGVNKDGKALFPVMPWHNYGKMTKSDIYSIIVYLRSLEPVKYDNPKSEASFPMNIIMKMMPSDAVLPENVDKSNTLEYGKYLTTAASCQDCHSQSEKGKPIPGMEFAGGMEFKTPLGTSRSANITPDKESGIGNWTKDEFVKHFQSFDPTIHPLIKVEKGEFNTVMPWNMYGGMKEEDLAAIYEYLRTVKAVKNKVVHFSAPDQRK